MSAFRVPDQAAFDAIQRKLKGGGRVINVSMDRPLKVPIFVEMRQSPIEAELSRQLTALKLPAWKRNHVFLEHRKFELDFCWESIRFGVEVQGNVHRIKARFKSDIEKFALALLAGWKLMPVGGDEIRSGQAATWIEQMLRAPRELR